MYDYSAVMACPNAETHTPSQELVTRSKLSCLSWNKYLRTYLASSDYEGVVHVWDIATGQNVVEYEAHEKRIWSVDFCQSDPTLLMSGSDDGMVKVYSRCQAVIHIAEQAVTLDCNLLLFFTTRVSPGWYKQHLKKQETIFQCEELINMSGLFQ